MVFDPKNPFADLEALRNPQDYEEFNNGEQVAPIRVKKLKEGKHYRVNPDPLYSLTNQYVVEKTGKEKTYFVYYQFRDALGPLTRRVNIHLAVDGHGEYFLLMIKQTNPGQDDNFWYDTARTVTAAAMQQWVKITKPQGGGWGHIPVQHKMFEPVWPTKTMGELLSVAFEGRVVNSLDHELVKEFEQLGA
jgi:hypothetical protein